MRRIRVNSHHSFRDVLGCCRQCSSMTVPYISMNCIATATSQTSARYGVPGVRAPAYSVKSVRMVGRLPLLPLVRGAGRTLGAHQT
jgi:hypothetical protein